MIANTLRMSLAEWLYRMSEAKLAPQGRVLAIYSAVFDITGNDELSSLSGLSPSTLDKWKKLLVRDGWVIVSQRGGGRGIGVKVSPAYKETPLSFTDVSPRNPAKFNTRNAAKTPPREIPVSAETPVRKPPVFSETPVRKPPVFSETPVSARGDFSRGEYNNNIYNINNNTLSHQDAARERGEHVGHGVFVNCKTITHKDFTISIDGIAMRCQAAGLTKDAIKTKLTGIALQWAAEIEGGRKPKDVLPEVINTALSRTILGDQHQEDIHYTRKSKAAKGILQPQASLNDAMRFIKATEGQRS